MKDFTSKIVHSLALNEAVEVVSEPIVGVNAPKQVHQCDNCADFYLVDEAKSESVCPECGGEGHPYGDIKECGDPANISNPNVDRLEESEDDEEAKAEAELLVTEGLRLLERNDYKRFNEGYRSRSRINRKGELEMIVESANGGFVTASRKMTSRQKSAYKLSEKYITTTRNESIKNKKNEAIKARRQELMIRNEMRSIKVQACRLLERQGASYDYIRFNEGMSNYIKSRNISERLSFINEDDEIGKEELDKMSPDQISDQVSDIIKDTGLEVISNNTDIEGDTATVDVKVQDSDDLEVHVPEVKEVLEDAFDAPVEIVGPTEADGDKSIQTLSVVINPDADVNEELMDTDDDLGKDCLNEDDEILDDEDEILEEDDEIIDDEEVDEEDDDVPPMEEGCNEDMDEEDADDVELSDEEKEIVKNESIRGARRRRNRRNESIKGNRRPMKRRNESF